MCLEAEGPQEEQEDESRCSGWVVLPLCGMQDQSVPTEAATGLFSLLFQKSKPKVVIASAEPAKEEKKTKTALKHQGARRRSQGNQQVAFSEQVTSPTYPSPSTRRRGRPLCFCTELATFSSKCGALKFIPASQ